MCDQVGPQQCGGTRIGDYQLGKVISKGVFGCVLLHAFSTHSGCGMQYVFL